MNPFSDVLQILSKYQNIKILKLIIYRRAQQSIIKLVFIKQTIAIYVIIYHTTGSARKKHP
jgi:hypothetical protein